MTDVSPNIDTHGFKAGDQVRPRRAPTAPLFEVTGQFQGDLLELRSQLGTRRWFRFSDVIKAEPDKEISNG